jgi:hypothetical protein
MRMRSQDRFQKRDIAMDPHLYAVGEIVSFKSARMRTMTSGGSYRIVSRLPEEDGEPSYRIKSDLERHERIARESELRERRPQS